MNSNIKDRLKIDIIVKEREDYSELWLDLGYKSINRGRVNASFSDLMAAGYNKLINLLMPEYILEDFEVYGIIKKEA